MSNGTYYKYFTKYSPEKLPKTTQLTFVGLNNGNLMTKGFLINPNTKVYYIDKTLEDMGDTSVISDIPDTFKHRWHFDSIVRIFYDEGLLVKIDNADSINVFNREGTDEWIITVGLSKKLRKELRKLR